MTKWCQTHICAHCGRKVPLPSELVLESGTTLTCNCCGKVTIVELFTPGERCTMPPQQKIWTEGDERDTWVDVSEGGRCE